MNAKDRGLALCRTCHTLTDRPGERCIVCGTKTEIRPRFSLQLVWAFWIAGIIAYIPGNLMPIMVTSSSQGETQSTIIDGIIALAHHGSHEIAAVIFVASIMVPVTKFIIIAWLAISVSKSSSMDEHRRHFAHSAVEFIGRWSMIDVFVVAALAALIQIGGIITISPGPGVDAFAFSVILTMLSAQCFDPRLIWDEKQALPEAKYVSA
ncbi:MAG: paraquat-inducible protein A [Pseudomonadota bacterium]